MEKFTADEKVAIVMESFTSNNISELCRRHGVSVASFYKWRVVCCIINMRMSSLS